MTGLVTFGDPGRFEIATRWVADPEPRDRKPSHGGWSTGEVRLTVGHHVLTRHARGTRNVDVMRWYLLPMFEWLAEHWVSLLHEERFQWREHSASPAATAAFLGLRRLIDRQDASGASAYACVQDWWSRHALRAADPSGLYPDVVIRRLVDDVEISWTARQPAHSPDGYRFALVPGAATMPVADVARPLWEVLQWAVSRPPELDAADRDSIVALERSIDRLRGLPTTALEAAYLPAELFRRVENVRGRGRSDDGSVRVDAVPALERIDDAVLMFGGVSPDIGAEDAAQLIGLLASQAEGRDGVALSALVDTSVGAPSNAPFEEGYELAEDFLAAIGPQAEAPAVDIDAIVTALDIKVVRKRLGTGTIRGVAVAGDNYGPAILVNMASRFNANEAGRRFTVAHELFHVLYDRERARRITHTSGPWAPPGIEKRANAFAAMLLMPRDLVRRTLPAGRLDPIGLFEAADAMQVGASALLEHLSNIGLIEEFQRDELRDQLLDGPRPALLQAPP